MRNDVWQHPHPRRVFPTAQFVAARAGCVDARLGILHDYCGAVPMKTTGCGSTGGVAGCALRACERVGVHGWVWGARLGSGWWLE